MAKTWLDLITPYQSGDHADGGDFTFSETEHYDGGTFAQTDRYHHIYSLQNANISTDDIIITGIRVTNDENTYLYGEEGYILEIEDNPFSIGKEQEVATHLGQKIIGMQFRPLTISSRSNPLIEAGDPAYVSHKGNSYQCYITNTTFTVGQYNQMSCDAKTPQGARVQGLSISTQNIINARREAKKEVSNYDLQVQQFTDLITQGLGLFPTRVQDASGGTIYYMHDQPTMSESSIRWYMTTGGMIQQRKVSGVWQTTSATDNQGNALYNVLSARGIIADWIKSGIIESQNGKLIIDLDNAKMISDNVDFEGKITATSGQISGFSIEDNELRVTFSKVFGPFNNDDLSKLISFILQASTPTEADFNKYDMTGKRNFSTIDQVYMERMINGTDPNPRTVSYTFKLKTGQSNNFIEITSSLGTTVKTNIGAGGITTHTGTYTKVDAGTVDVSTLILDNKVVTIDSNGFLKIT